MGPAEALCTQQESRCVADKGTHDDPRLCSAPHHTLPRRPPPGLHQPKPLHLKHPPPYLGTPCQKRPPRAVRTVATRHQLPGAWPGSCAAARAACPRSVLVEEEEGSGGLAERGPSGRTALPRCSRVPWALTPFFSSEPPTPSLLAPRCPSAHAMRFNCLHGERQFACARVRQSIGQPWPAWPPDTVMRPSKAL